VVAGAVIDARADVVGGEIAFGLDRLWWLGCRCRCRCLLGVNGCGRNECCKRRGDQEIADHDAFSLCAELQCAAAPSCTVEEKARRGLTCSHFTTPRARSGSLVLDITKQSFASSLWRGTFSQTGSFLAVNLHRLISPHWPLPVAFREQALQMRFTAVLNKD